MEPAVVRIQGLPDSPLDAATAFFAEHLPAARQALGGADLVVLVFALAGHQHRAWRLAAIQELAREAAPKRVNGIAGDSANAIDEAVAYLGAAPGVTGQLLAVDGKSAEKG